MNEVKIDLKHPVKDVTGEIIQSLTVRSPKVRDMIAAEKAFETEGERGVYLMSLLCGVSPKVIEEMEMIDYRQLQKVSQGFLS